MTEIKVSPCANGIVCNAVYDCTDRTVTIFGENNMVLGFFRMGDLNDAIIRDELKTICPIKPFEKIPKK